MNIRDNLLGNSSLSFENNLFYQRGIERSLIFEKKYLGIREKENRIYTDELVRELPEIPDSNPLRNEWSIRKITLLKLTSYLKKSNHNGSILELGCGNGWLAHHLAASLNAQICGLDINERELLQGVRNFGAFQNLTFVYGDIFTLDFKDQTFDTIVLASSIQYFSDLKHIIQRLFELLSPHGEIHIMDSPFYSSLKESQAARKRSRDYFNTLGFPEMTDKYFHHTKFELKDFNYEILFNPRRLIPIINRSILKNPDGVFPWIKIKSH